MVQAEVGCPYCGEVFALQIDTSQPSQCLVEDCAVCCRPMTLTIRSQPGVIIDLGVEG